MSNATPAAAHGGASIVRVVPLPWLAGGAAVCALLVAVLLMSRGSPADLGPSERSHAVTPVVIDVARGAAAHPAEPAGTVTSSGAVDARRQAAAAYIQGDHATALAQLEEAVKASPDDAEARNGLGQLLVRQGRAGDAIPHFDEAVRLAEGRWAYRFNRARAYGLVDRWTDAVADYRAAAAAFPDDHATLFNLGLALMRAHDYAGAVDALERAVAEAPEEHDFLISLGTAYIGAERPDRAQDTFERFLAVAPSSPEAEKVKALLETLAASRP